MTVSAPFPVLRSESQPLVSMILFSDLPLFKVAGRAIALNARSDARAATDEHLDTDDLRDLLPLLGL